MFQFEEVNPFHPLYPFAEELLTEAFPVEERPSLKDWRERFQNEFHRCVILQGGNAIGLLSYWDFTQFIYIEHFAINAELRNQKLGGKVLDQFIQGEKCVVLEAELPTTPLAIRRIKFYQRHGFSIAPYPYEQPAYAEGLPTVTLHILATQEISATLFEEIRQLIHREVYNNSNNY